MHIFLLIHPDNVQLNAIPRALP